MLGSDNDDRNLKAPARSSQLVPEIIELWRDLPMNDDVEKAEIAEALTRQTLPNVLNDLLYTEMRTTGMAHLGDILLGNQYPRMMEDDEEIGRLSLAYENFFNIPKFVCDEFGPSIKILDISNNNIKNLEILEAFSELTSLIADKNPINSLDTRIPWLPKLELLYLNHCRIDNLYWIETLRYNCPNLKYLSLMGNPAVSSLFLNADNFYQYLHYRSYVIAIIPDLVHLDDKQVTDDERVQAKKMYSKPLVKSLLKRTRSTLPRYLSNITGRKTQ